VDWAIMPTDPSLERLHWRTMGRVLPLLLLGALVCALAAGCSRVQPAPPTPTPVFAPVPGLPAGLLGRWRLEGSSPQAWLGIDFEPDGVVVLDRGVATYSGTYAWQPDRLTIESAGLRYVFEARLHGDELTLQSQELGRVLYRRASS
jgi:hypothetical protein